MFSALLYLQFVSLKNRLWLRFKRLKQPKYLFGAIAGLAYLYFYFFRYMFAGRYGHSPTPFFQTDPVLAQSLGALVLLVFVLLAWVVPHKRAALTFSEAEIAFLFPAPMSRRTLIHFKLLRSQFTILVSTFFLTLFFRRAGGHVLIRAAGWWVILMTLNLHILGSSFALTALMDRGISTWKRRVIVIGLALGALAGVVVWAVRSLPPLTDESIQGMDAFMDYARQALVSGPLPYLLYPFRLVVRPYLATDAAAFFEALWPAALLMAAHYGWVVRSDVAFEEASVEASKRQAERVRAVRSGRSLYPAGKKLQSKRAPFNLAPVGLQPVALLWKNLLSAGQGFSRRVWFILLWLTVVAVFSTRGLSGSDWLPLVAGLAAMLGAWSILLGPQLVRQDLRQDIGLMDLLKSYPMRGWQVVFGEILAPAVILTAVQWLLLIVSVGFFSRVPLQKMPGGMVYAMGAGAAVVLPMLNLISLLIPNAAVLIFPGWFQGGRDAPQGIEATGQRLIFALGQFLALILALLPAAAVFAVVFFIVRYGTGLVSPAIPLASVGAALALAVEAGLGMLWLGKIFEGYDLSAEQAG